MEIKLVHFFIDFFKRIIHFSLGMENLQFTKEMRDQINDLSAFNYGVHDKNKIEEKTRDGQRTPMQWNSNENNAGFSNAKQAYHPLSKSWKTVSVQDQLNSTNSHLNLFKQLVQLKAEEPFFTGKFRIILVTKQIFAFIRYSIKPIPTPIYLIIINMIGAYSNDKPDECIQLNFIDLLKCQDKNAQGIIRAKSTNIKQNSPLFHQGQSIRLDQISLKTSEAVLLQLDLNIEQIQIDSS